jgi:hypothetical protein
MHLAISSSKPFDIITVLHCLGLRLTLFHSQALPVNHLCGLEPYSLGSAAFPRRSISTFSVARGRAVRGHDTSLRRDAAPWAGLANGAAAVMLAAVLSGVDLALRRVLMARSSDLYCRVGCCSDSARVGKRAQRAPYADIALIEIGHAGLYRGGRVLQLKCHVWRSPILSTVEGRE